MPILYRKSLRGPAPEIQYWTVGAVAVKYGDAVILGATRDVVIPATAATDVIVGVALGDAAIGATAAIMPALGDTVFEFPTHTTAGDGYDASGNKYDVCDLQVFTSGAMKAAAGTDASHQIMMYDLASGQTDDTDPNAFLGIFNLRYFDTTRLA